MTPFERSSLNLPGPKEFIAECMDTWGCTRKEAKAQYNRLKQDEIWVNDLYQVNIDRNPIQAMGVDMIHVSVKRLDRQAIHDWRHLQQIKDELVGPGHEGFELYPADERKVDVANQYHLWVFADPHIRIPVGFVGREVSYENRGGAVQRPQEN